MLFTCPQCKTSYDVPASQVDNVRNLRCAECGRVWSPVFFEEPQPIPTENQEGEQQENQEGEPISFDPPPPPFDDMPIGGPPSPREEDIDLSAVKDIFHHPEKRPLHMVWLRPLYFFSIICIAVSIYLFFFYTPEKFPIVFESVRHDHVEKDYKKYLVLTANIHNESDKDAHLETLKVKFFNTLGRQITSGIVKSPLEMIPAGKSETVQIEIERPPAQAANATLVIDKVRFEEPQVRPEQQSDALVAVEEPKAEVIVEKPTGKITEQSLLPVEEITVPDISLDISDLSDGEGEIISPPAMPETGSEVR